MGGLKRNELISSVWQCLSHWLFLISSGAWGFVCVCACVVTGLREEGGIGAAAGKGRVCISGGVVVC